MDEAVSVRQFRRFDYFRVSRVQPAIANVLHHRATEEESILQDDAELFADRILRQRADIDAVDADTPAADIVEAAEQADDGRFTGAGRSD